MYAFFTGKRLNDINVHSLPTHRHWTDTGQDTTIVGESEQKKEKDHEELPIQDEDIL